MGLAIVSRIALWHDANIEIGECSELSGAEFRITFNNSNP